ncbi:MAG: adenylosuccinate synthase [Oscillospiraceae bacterium]|nr:adenylosuccinate synthase [Oscillospiraceae bacterium]
MPAKVVVGVQWGDEGKGKVIDILASRSDVVVRSQGGNNAGHTISHQGETYKLALLPSGVLYPKVDCYIGCGVVINPATLLGEIDAITARGVSCDRLRIDPRAHVVMPWHITLDGLSEDGLGKDKIGTTRRGIGPCYMDKAERVGLRMHELCDPTLLRQKIQAVGTRKNQLLSDFYGCQPLDLWEITAEFEEYGKRLRPYLSDVSDLTWQALQDGKNVLFEGAQGTLLDLDLGTYPYVTSSNPVSGGVCVGTGIGPTAINEVLGVAKAYTTRVGGGPFPTELFDEVGNTIRDVGHEYGTNTGRPRRVGWFDAVIARYGVRVNGLTGLIVNKLDTLSGISTLKVCTAYETQDGQRLTSFPAAIEQLELCRPVYAELPGFSEDISGCRTFAELPRACREYIAFLEETAGCPIVMVGVGPGREQMCVK